MSGSILQKYTVPSMERSLLSDRGTALSESVDEVGENLGCFGWLRGVRDRAVTLELRKKNGNIRAIAYAWIEAIDFDASEGITLHVSGKQLRIKGRHLIRPNSGGNADLFAGICRHRVPWVQEADRPTLLSADDSVTIVDSIEW